MEFKRRKKPERKIGYEVEIQINSNPVIYCVDNKGIIRGRYAKDEPLHGNGWAEWEGLGKMVGDYTKKGTKVSIVDHEGYALEENEIELVDLIVRAVRDKDLGLVIDSPPKK